MTLLENAELFAKLKHAGKLKKSGTTYSIHLENVIENPYLMFHLRPTL